MTGQPLDQTRGIRKLAFRFGNQYRANLGVRFQEAVFGRRKIEKRVTVIEYRRSQSHATPKVSVRPPSVPRLPRDTAGIDAQHNKHPELPSVCCLMRIKRGSRGNECRRDAETGSAVQRSQAEAG